MALTESIRKTDREVLADSCVQCATGRVYEPDEPGEAVATWRWICPQGRTMAAGRS
jgi:hypothetical protein